MMTLDQRARRAADAVHESVAEYTPPAPFAVAVRRRRWVQVAQGAVAFAAVVLFIAIGALLRPVPEPDVANENPPTIEESPEPDITEPDPNFAPDLETPINVFEPEVTDDAPEPQPSGEPEAPEAPVEEPVDTVPPPLVITSPAEGDHFDVTTIWFEGTTEPGATVFAGRWEADVDEVGNWAIKLVLSEGANRATFTATDVAGNQTTASVVVHYDPPPPPPKDDEKPPEEPKDWKFTAFLVYGTCAETPPYDVFYGTGKPGSTISIYSEYGNGSVEVNAKGEWEVKVYFEEAPLGKAFAVKVEDAFGSKKVFEFKHIE